MSCTTITPGARALSRRERAGDEAEEDREKGRRLDQRIAGGQFFRFQMLRQKADISPGRTEPRWCRGRRAQHREAAENRTNARRGDGLDEDLADLQTSARPGLVMRVGQFAGEARQEHRWQDENPDGQRDQRAGILAAEAKQDRASPEDCGRNCR